MAQCVGVKKDGVRCTTIVFNEIDHCRCGTHMKTYNKVGPNQIRRIELGYIHGKIASDAYNQFRAIMNDGNLTELEVARQRRIKAQTDRENQITFQLERNALEETINREIEANGGLDADRPFIQRENQRRNERARAVQARFERRHAERQAWRQQQQQPQPEGLAAFAADRQNVHTAVVVQQVKDSVDKILQIPVPLAYQGSQRTLGEIIVECNIPDAATLQMSMKYCSLDDIYDLGHGIYRRVLDCVWQFIKTSPDSDNLKRILATEMIDNIGMCAQGNLSRLCNILSGYLDGINMDIKSKNVLLAERLAPLAELANYHTRMEQARAIFEELEIPENDRAVWLEPLQEA